jgi:anaerobic dimethyl sulfoxide reductase subunit B (iron-sulfur subunit)
MLQNGSDVKRRNIHVYNKDAYKHLPVVNVSMSCNHCTDASCMETCPVKAFSRDESTGAVLLDESRCIGCKYCTWNCRYEAPAFNRKKGTVEKCNMCIDLLAVDSHPACVSSCPTGALKFNELKKSEGSWPLWIPREDSLYEFTGKYNRIFSAYDL